jgi:hypothetical protein
MFEPSSEALARVRQVVADAAAVPIQAGRAELAVGRLADLVEQPDDNCPVVILTPVDPDAARIVVEVQADELWWGERRRWPATELYVGMKEGGSLRAPRIDGSFGCCRALPPRAVSAAGTAAVRCATTVGGPVRDLRDQ